MSEKPVVSYASLGVRMMALLYESCLIFSVFLAALVPAAMVSLLFRTQGRIATILVGVIIVGAWYAYFLTFWTKGQTLPMKTWHIALFSANGKNPTRKQLHLRFMWACLFLVLIPALVYWISRTQGIEPTQSAVLGILWWILPWGWALLNHHKQFLYDVLAGTVLVRTHSS